MRDRLRFLFHREGGQALVEMALVLPFILMPVLLGIIDMGRAMNEWNQTTNLANLGARVSAVGALPTSGACDSGATYTNTGGSHTVADIQTYVQCEGSIENRALADATVCVFTSNSAGVATATSTTGNPVKVTVSLTYSWFHLLGIGASSTISGSATMRLEQTFASTLSNNTLASC